MIIDFIYVNYKKEKDTISSIATLKKLTKDSNISGNVYVIDNSFTERDDDIIVELSKEIDKLSEKDFKIWYQPSDENLGFGRGCNKGVRLSSSELIAFTNCDTDFSRTDPNEFRKMIAAILGNKKVAIAGPKIVNSEGLLHASCFSFDPISILFKPARHIRKIGPHYTKFIPRYQYFKKLIDRITYEGLNKTIPSYVDWVSGCFMVTKRSFFMKASGFDDRYFLYFEDVDLCRKARKLGKGVIFYPKVDVIHNAHHESSSQKGIIRSLTLNRTSRYHVSSWIKYCIKWRWDYARKIINILRYKLKREKRPKSPSGYGMDFSSYRHETLTDTENVIDQANNYPKGKEI